jgi:hypothetical protein
VHHASSQKPLGKEGTKTSLAKESREAELQRQRQERERTQAETERIENEMERMHQGLAMVRELLLLKRGGVSTTLRPSPFQSPTIDSDGKHAALQRIRTPTVRANSFEPAFLLLYLDRIFLTGLRGFVLLRSSTVTTSR